MEFISRIQGWLNIWKSINIIYYNNKLVLCGQPWNESDRGAPFRAFPPGWASNKGEIPKDKDGKPKQFAFVNFKHEVSVPYAMNLLNGIKLYGRPIKIQFRSGSSHALQDVSLPYPQHHVGNSSPTSTSPSRYERTRDNMTSSAQIIQRSFSSPENFQRQAVVGWLFFNLNCQKKFILS